MVRSVEPVPWPAAARSRENPARWPSATLRWVAPDWEDAVPGRGLGAALLELLRDGNTPPFDPVCLAYAGHQFGQFVPTLGDGRAHALGVLATPAGRVELQLKGSGRTLYSRGGDGKATLGSVLREVLVSASLHHLGIPTSRGVAVLATGERIARERSRPGAVLARVATSHLRVGSFQYFACRGDTAGVQQLADLAIERHDPDLVGRPDRVPQFFARVVARQARLVALWQSVGFVHGVMNTDNMTVSGETLDFGPCAFLDTYRENQVFSAIDRQGRYAYGEQPRIAVWNLARLGECLLPLCGPDPDAALAVANAALADFGPRYATAWRRAFGAKLGLPGEGSQDEALCRELLGHVERGGVDFTVGFRALADLLEGEPATVKAWAALAADRGFAGWLSRWRARVLDGGADSASVTATLCAVNPLYLARNHLVEAAIDAAEERDDLAPFHRLLAAVSAPYAERTDAADLSRAPRPEERVPFTTCNT